MDLKKLYLKIYRILGFTFLVSLAGAIFYYASLMIFFVFSSSWIAPTVLSPTSDKMLPFSAGYLQAVQNFETLKAAASQAKRETELAHNNAKQLHSLLDNVQNYAQQTNKLASNRQLDLENSQKLAHSLESFKKQTEDSLKAGLIGAPDAAEAMAQIQSFRNGIADGRISLGTTRIGSVTQLIQIQQQIAQAESDEQTKRDAYKAASVSLEVASKALSILERTSYRRAMNGGANLAFVPYENLKSVKVGAPVYDCYLLVIACHQVGEIEHIYDDEQVVDYPIFNVRFSRTVRGVLVSMKMESRKFMSSPIFFSGGKPLFF